MTNELSPAIQRRWLKLCNYCILDHCCRTDENGKLVDWFGMTKKYPNCLIWAGRKHGLTPEETPNRFTVTPEGLKFRNGKVK
jgi:hypothetical protein